MSILKMLGGGDGIERLARQLGIDPAAADGLAKMLAPAIGSAAKKRAEAGGLDNVLTELKGEGNARFFDEPEAAAADDARARARSPRTALAAKKQATAASKKPVESQTSPHRTESFPYVAAKETLR